LCDSRGDGVLGAAVQRQKPELRESWAKPKSLELIRKKKNHQTIGKNVWGLSNFFHDQHYIWISICRYNSIRNPITIVGYGMEVEDPVHSICDNVSINSS
jgi:hypothetical protein